VRFNRLCKLSFVLCAALAFPRAAAAFGDSTQFFDQPMNPHSATTGAASEGVYFTGGPRFAGLGCESCHVDAPGLVALKLGADDPFLFHEGYEPDRTYTFEVELNGETRGVQLDGTPTCTEPRSLSDRYTYVACNNNNFALEIDAPGGAPLGLFGAFPGETVIAPDGSAVFGDRAHDANMPKVISRNGPTRWRFSWTAPAAGTGAVTIHVSAVDGNGGEGMEDDDQDPIGDDTVTAAITLAEHGAAPPPSAAAGCAVALAVGGVASPSAFMLLIPAIALVVRRRRR
jgi:hypothetical protein